MSESAQRILQRAKELNIVIWVEDDKIKCSGHGAIPPKMVEVIRTHKGELIPYLSALEQQEKAHLRQEPTLCCACLDQDLETPAHFVGPNDVMYCQKHYDALPSDWHKAEMERIAQAYRELLPSNWKITVGPRGKQAERKPEAGQNEDYWAETRQKLMRRGYYEQVAQDEERLRQLTIGLRTYPAPFPAYALAEVGGVKRLQVVGMWHQSENRLMTEQELQAEQ